MADETCRCPCCQQGIEAPHEYHLERRPMARVNAAPCDCGATCEDKGEGCRYIARGVAEAPATHCRVKEIPLTDEQRKLLSVSRNVSIPGVTEVPRG